MEQIFIEELTGHFNLREPKGKKPSTIFFVVRLDGKQYKLSIGVKCYPKFWSKRKQECYTGVNISELDQKNNLTANQQIIMVKARFLEFKQYLCDNIHQLDNKVEVLRRYILPDMGTTKKKEVVDLVQYFSDYVENTFSAGTVHAYSGTIQLLDCFVKHRKKMPTFNELATTEFFKEWQQFLVNDYISQDGNKLLASYVNKAVPRLKSFLSKAVEDKYITETVRSNIVIKALPDKSAKDNELFLWNNEVVELFNYQCDNKTDELIKDIFLLECTTGYRLSDVTKVDENIEESFGVEEITLVTKKTSQKIRCQLIFDIAKKILEKYDYNIPAISKSSNTENVVMNRQLKIIAKNAGFKRKWKQSKHHVGDSKSTVVEKDAFEFVKTHTGRHTFICLLKLRGWDNSRISKYTGQSLKMVERYANSLQDSDYSRFENMRKLHPELIVKTIDEVAEEKANKVAHSKKGTVLNGVFGYDKLMELADLMQHNISIYGRSITDDCKRIILSTNNLSKAVDYCQGKELSELKKKALELNSTVKALTRIYSDLNIYKTYEYKLFKLCLIKEEEITPDEVLEQMFNDESETEIE